MIRFVSYDEDATNLIAQVTHNRFVRLLARAIEDVKRGPDSPVWADDLEDAIKILNNLELLLSKEKLTP